MTQSVAKFPTGSKISEPDRALQSTAIPDCNSQPGIVLEPISDETFHRGVLGSDADWILYVATAIFISEVILVWPR